MHSWLKKFPDKYIITGLVDAYSDMKTVGVAFSPGVQPSALALEERSRNWQTGSRGAVTFRCCCQETGRRSVTQNFPNTDPQKAWRQTKHRFLALKLPYSLHESHKRRGKIGINRLVAQQANHSTAGTRSALEPLRSKSEGIRCSWGSPNRGTGSFIRQTL